MIIIDIIFSVILILGGSFVLYLAFFGKHEEVVQKKTIRTPASKDPTEDDLVNAMLDSIQNGDWQTSTFGTSPCMRNTITDVKIYLDGTLAGMFCYDSYKWQDRKNAAKVVQAYKDYAGITKNGWDAIAAITGYQKPADDVDPAVLKEAKKNLKLWSK